MTLALHVRLLGAFQIRHYDEAVKGFDQARLQELLAYLLLHRTNPVPRQQLAFLFWPDSTEEQARTNLRNLWHRLRRSLPDADRFLIADELTVQWRDDDACWSDVAAFELHLKRAGSTASTEEQIANLEQVVTMYGGELLPGCYSDWLLAERDRLAQAYGHAMEQLVGLYEGRREYRQAIGHAQALLRHDPLHEPGYIHLMRLHALNDDRAAALHTYHTCVTVLRSELDVEPGQATRDQYERLLNGKTQPAALPKLEAAIPLMGRDAEWALLQRAWRDAANGPRLALISGEAGIGKTRLAEALVEWVSRQGIPAPAAHCFATEGELAYAPIVAWLRSHPRPLLADHRLRELARLLPEILVENPDLPPPEPLTEPWQRLHLFEALAHGLLTGRSALLLFLDDLQWCDRDTLDWLHYLLQAREALGMRVQLLVVVTVRLEDAEDRKALDSWKAGLSRTGNLTEIDLGPLSLEATLALADRVAGRPFDRAFGQLLFQGTEGHPLFIVEMVRAGFGAGHAAVANHAATVNETTAALPAKVHQVLKARLAQLSPPARGVIELAAVIGRAFTYGVLAGASDLGEDVLVSCLDECWRRRIIREQGDDTYDFTHDKLRETAYAGLSRTRRRWLHSRVAQALEMLYAGDVDMPIGQIAAHYEQADRPKSAIGYYGQAAAAAQRIYANAEAMRLYQHLLNGELRKSLSANETCTLMLGLGEVWRVNGQWAEAQVINQEAMREAAAMGDVALEAQAQRALADVLRLQGHYDTALEWLLKAEVGFETTGEWRGVVGALWTMGEIYWFKGNHKQAMAALEQQFEVATRMNDQRGICEALDTMGMVYWSQGDWDQSLDCCQRSIAIAEPLGYHLVITRAAITIGNVYASQRAAADAISWYLRAGALARQIDDRQVLAWATANIAEILTARGESLLALSGHIRAMTIALDIGDRWTACLNNAYACVPLEHLQRYERAEFFSRRAIGFGRRLGIPTYLSGMLFRLARLLLEQGRATEACPLFDEARELMSLVEGEQVAGEDTRFEADILDIQYAAHGAC